jgi:hypothetical protein
MWLEGPSLIWLSSAIRVRLLLGRGRLLRPHWQMSSFMSIRDKLIAGIIIALLCLGGWLVLRNGGQSDRPTAAQKPPEFGDARIKNGPALGCVDVADLNRVLRYFSQGRQGAADKATTDLVNSQRCVLLADSEKVFVERVIRGVTSVRRPGEVTAYWTQNERVDAD